MRKDFTRKDPSLTSHFDVTMVLLENVADVEAKNKDGYTSLLLASEEGHFDLAMELLEKGADVKAKAGRIAGHQKRAIWHSWRRASTCR